MSIILLCLAVLFLVVVYIFFFKQKTAYEMRISDWSSDVCSSDLIARQLDGRTDVQRIQWHGRHMGMSTDLYKGAHRRGSMPIGDQRLRASQTSAAPATATMAPLRVQTVSPSMKLLAGQRPMSRPCNTQSSPPKNKGRTSWRE